MLNTQTRFIIDLSSYIYLLFPRIKTGNLPSEQKIRWASVECLSRTGCYLIRKSITQAPNKDFIWIFMCFFATDSIDY